MRPISPLHTEAFQADESRRCRPWRRCRSHRRGAEHRNQGCRSSSRPDRGSPRSGRPNHSVVTIEPGVDFRKVHGLALTNFALVTVFLVVTPAPVNNAMKALLIRAVCCPGNSRMLCWPRHGDSRSTRRRGSGNPESIVSAGCGRRPFLPALRGCRCCRFRHEQRINQPVR